MKVKISLCCGVVGKSVIARVVVAVEFEVSVYTMPVLKEKVCAAENVAAMRVSVACLADNRAETYRLDTFV